MVSRLAGACTSTTGVRVWSRLIARWRSLLDHRRTGVVSTDRSLAVAARPPGKRRCPVNVQWFRGSLALAPQPPAYRRDRSSLASLAPQPPAHKYDARSSLSP